MKKFIAKEFDLSFGEAIDKLLKLKNKKAFIVLFDDDIGYVFNKNGILTQIDTTSDITYDDLVIDKSKIQPNDWVLYVEMTTRQETAELNCLDKD